MVIRYIKKSELKKEREQFNFNKPLKIKLSAQLKGKQMSKKHISKETEAGEVAQGKPIKLDEFGKHDGIQPVAENDFNGQMDLEAFMNEVLTIQIADSPFKNAKKVVTPTVNGINQPIIRGYPVKVKRKYVEALARCRETDYDQTIPDMNRPEVAFLKPRTTLVEPFTVLDDPNPAGRAWLQAILAERD